MVITANNVNNVNNIIHFSVAQKEIRLPSFKTFKALLYLHGVDMRSLPRLLAGKTSAVVDKGIKVLRKGIHP